MSSADTDSLLAGDAQAPLPEVVDHVAVARLYGEPLFALPTDLYIPPDALEIFLEAFEGPLRQQAPARPPRASAPPHRGRRIRRSPACSRCS